MSRRRAWIGIIGNGFVGASLAARIADDRSLGLDVAFVAARHPRKGELGLATVSADLVAERGADLVVEAAHPDITRALGRSILRSADYLPLSTTALVDDDLRADLEATAQDAGTRLVLPHGALVGGDSLLEWREQWAAVTITFRKHPRAIDFAVSGIDPAGIAGPTTLYDGPVRGIAPMFPRNVNTMVTCALATVGLDACRGVLVADPALDVAVAEVVAIGKDGSRLETTRRQPAVGVSGTEMMASLLRSIQVATGRLGRPALA
ncbi:MAG: aspartate dehydrogenase domain-containing protein [Chloroflexota bacterium]